MNDFYVIHEGQPLSITNLCELACSGHESTDADAIDKLLGAAVLVSERRGHDTATALEIVQRRLRKLEHGLLCRDALDF